MIETLFEKEAFQNQLVKRQQSEQQTKQNIHNTRMVYREVAKRGSLIYFCIKAMENLESMYQWSLNFFLSLFRKIVQGSSHDGDQES